MKNARLVSFSLLLLAANTAYAEGDIPQMDQTWYPNQLLWLAVSFGLLFFIVSKFIAPRISGIIATRENAISEAIRDAERAKREAESTSGNVATASQQARQRASEIMAQSQAENTAEAAKAFAKLDHDLERKADHAAAVLADAMKKANAGIEDAVQELAQAMTAKLLGEPSKAKDGPSLKLAVKR